MNTRLSTLSMALAMAFAAPSALALGLGQMQVRSGINQPLVAEIPIISASPAEVTELDVRLAPPEAFAAVGLDRPYDLSANLQFSVGKNTAGQPVIRVTTVGRFNEPVLSFLIEANWSTGNVTREYTALIDPPYIAPAVVHPMSAPAIVAAPAPAAPIVSAPAPAPALPPESAAPAETEPAETEPASESAPVVASPMPESAAAPPPQPVAAAPAPQPAPPAPRPVATPAPSPALPAPAAPSPPGSYGPVAEGNTLWSIANQVKPDASVSVNQVMLALLRINPDAFADGNINQLKSGAVLRIPNRDDIATLSPDDAAALVREQATAWKPGRPAVPQPAEGVAQSAPPAPSPVASTPPPPRPAARLEIVPPSGNASARGTQSGAAAGGGGSELRAELLQTKEDLAARTAEVTELKSRVSDLEKQEADRQHLIDLQNSQLKDLQTRLEQQSAQAPVAAAEPAPAESPAAAAATPAATDAAQETPLYLNPWIWGGGVLILVGGLVFAFRRKPAPAAADNSTSSRLSDDEALRASLAKTRAGSIRPAPISTRESPLAAKVSSPVTPVSMPMPMPVAAAPVDSELDSCTKAVASNPHDIEAHLNLLRLHHSRGNAVDYEAAATQMREQVSSTLDPRWREAVIMGASLMPGHALFNQAGWNAPRFETAEPVAKAPPSFVTDRLPPVPAPDPMPATGVFDPPVEEVAVQAQPDEDLHLDSVPDFGDGGLDLIDAPGALADAIPGQQDEASATRIELAKAYLDIGDLDGARSMLEEVLAEGGPAAQAEAERILREIG